MLKKLPKLIREVTRGRAFTGPVTGDEEGKRKSLSNFYLLFSNLLQ